jgi:hypothetical protein
MTGQELELVVDRVGVRAEQSEAVDGRAMDGGEVGLVGLVAGIGRLAKLLGGEGVDDADLEARGGEGGLDDMVTASGPLDGDSGRGSDAIGRPGGTGWRRPEGRAWSG